MQQYLFVDVSLNEGRKLTLKHKNTLQNCARSFTTFFKKRELPLRVKNMTIDIANNGEFIATGLKKVKNPVRLPIHRFIAALSLPQSHLFQYLNSNKQSAKPFSLNEKRVLAILTRISNYNIKKVPYKKVQMICKRYAWYNNHFFLLFFFLITFHFCSDIY